ncbi:zinc finger protein 415 [Condylostylus longicornis]|uniref:zinc finger protein 415 n=1 Tax=Condylostylus longicornis TaxID=2530218 RepID=UPI00244E1F6E|nr:zinc finger protein 415 [Condylostylus longicornis]
MENKSCSSCFCAITNKNRLIIESCGHTKCRSCFINEESSCKQCIVINSEIKVVENIVISPELSQPESKSKTLKQHIVNIGDQYKCTICDKIFRSRQQQYYHLHCDKPEESRPFKCGECFRGFSKAGHLKYHLKTHSVEKSICSLCKKEFSNKATLDKHLMRHKYQKKYVCRTCQAEYKDENSFKFHLNSHDDSSINRFSCNICNKIFFIRSQLKRHTVIHKKDRAKLFECNICDSKFFRASSLKNHIVKHNYMNKFKCDTCCKQFTEEKALRRHMALHDSVIGYQCGICDTKLNRKDNLIRHVRNMHPDCNIKITSDAILKTKCVKNLENSAIKTKKKENKMETSTVAINEKEGSFNLKSTNSSLNCAENIEIEKKYIQCSVIKSIGNARPLDVVLSPRNIDKSHQKTTLPINSINISVLANKKLKKKYDPTEIYRKILFVNNDDMSTSGKCNITIQPNDNNVKQDYKMDTKETNPNDDATYPNFVEKHWRKNFYS